MKKPWDKLPNETDEQYARFLLYRNIGPKRSMRKAYARYLREYDGFRGGSERLHVPGNWIANCRDLFWTERAFAWDVRNLAAYGGKVASLHAAAVAQVARKNLRWAKRLNPGDKGWPDLMRSMMQVQAFLTPELVRGIQDRNQSANEPVAAVNADDGVE